MKKWLQGGFEVTRWFPCIVIWFATCLLACSSSNQWKTLRKCTYEWCLKSGSNKYEIIFKDGSDEGEPPKDSAAVNLLHRFFLQLHFYTGRVSVLVLFCVLCYSSKLLWYFLVCAQRTDLLMDCPAGTVMISNSTLFKCKSLPTSRFVSTKRIM